MEAETLNVDQLWDYAHPQATEQRFAALLGDARKTEDRSYLVELLTQIARAQGLQDRFADADRTLDRAEALLTPEMHRPLARVLLERGRVLNSSGHPAKAMPLFERAWKAAEMAGAARFAIDAVHMLAIAAADPREQIAWNLRGIEMVANDPSQKRWLAALYNNLGESCAKAGEYQQALDAFQKLGNDPYALKDQSRMLRMLGRPGEALAIVEPLIKQRKEPDGWISAEYAECLAAAGDGTQARHFATEGYALLKDDAWIKKNDPAMLDHLKILSEQK